MSLRFRKTVGMVLALGLVLQVACASLASITGDCPISMSVSAPKSETAQIPPCHQSKEEGKAEKPSSSSNDCCEKELTLSIADSIKTFDWEKLSTELVVLDWFFPKESAHSLVFENDFFDEKHFDVSSPPKLLSLLQVFLI